MLKHAFIALAGMGAGLIGFGPAAASAFPVQPAPAVTADGSTLLTEVRSRYDRNRRYDRHRDGRRCGSWSHHCRYRYGGYYYENPWWIVPAFGVGIALGAAAANDGYGGGYGNRHVAWCMDRYRSYNPRYNTWVSYGGRVRQCISPYGP